MPFIEFLKAIWTKNKPVKVYIGSMLKDPATLFKFGYVWMFYQPNKDEYARTVMKLFDGSEDLVRKYLKQENITNEAVGYRDTSLVIVTKNTHFFADFMHGRDLTKEPHLIIDREKEPEKMEQEVD